MIVKIPTIVVTAKDKKYRLTRDDFSFVRLLVLSARDASYSETTDRIQKLLESSLRFKNKKAFTLKLEPLEVDTAGFSITSTQAPLTARDTHYMVNVITCAAAQPDTVVILPSYIKVVSPALTAVVSTKPKAKRKRRKPSGK